MNLAQYLHELLLENETVIIPGFGAFISNYKPAEIDNEINKIVPPSKEIIFNPKIRNNDGLLVGFVAAAESVSHFDALKIIEKEREKIIYQLDKGEEIAIENVGRLTRNAENEIQFEAGLEENLLLDSFGLESVSFEKMEETGEKIGDETIDVQETKEEPEQQEVIESEEPVEDESQQDPKDIDVEQESDMEVREDVTEENVVNVSEEEENPQEPIYEDAGKFVSEVKITEEVLPEITGLQEKKPDDFEPVETNQNEAVAENGVDENEPVDEKEEGKEEPVLEAVTGDHGEQTSEGKAEENRKKRGWIWFLLIFIPLILAGLYLAKDEYFPRESNVPAIPESSIGEVPQPQEDLQVLDTIEEISEQNLPDDSVEQITEENTSIDTVLQETKRFYLVGGSFKEEENVNKFMEEFDAEGYEPFLLGKRGNFFIVALGSYSTEKQALLAKDTFAERNPDSGIWVFEDK